MLQLRDAPMSCKHVHVNPCYLSKNRPGAFRGKTVCHTFTLSVSSEGLFSFFSATTARGTIRKSLQQPNTLECREREDFCSGAQGALILTSSQKRCYSINRPVQISEQLSPASQKAVLAADKGETIEGVVGTCAGIELRGSTH